MSSHRRGYRRADSGGQLSELMSDVDFQQEKPTGNKALDVRVTEAGSSDDGASQQALASTQYSLYRPFWHRRSVLFAFIVTYIVLLLALIAIYSVDRTHQGLTRADSRDYYLWTYGPTAVFTLLYALWTRVEYQAKQLSPWYTLGRGDHEFDASKHVLLDYISPITPTCLYRSIRNSHHTVTAVVLGSLILKLAIVLSTNLLQLDIVPIHTMHSVDMKQDFQDQADFSRLVQDTMNLTAFKDNVNGPGAVAIISELSDTQLPWGTTRDLAFQPFRASTLTAGNLTVDGVKAFSATLLCEEATLDERSDFTCHDQSESGCDGTCAYMVPSPQILEFRLSDESKILGTMAPRICNIPSDGFYGFSFTGYQGFVRDDAAYRLVLSNVFFINGKAHNSSSVSCRPSWSLGEVSVNTAVTTNQEYAPPVIKDVKQGTGAISDLRAKMLVDAVTNCTSGIYSANSFFDAVLTTSSLDASVFSDWHVLRDASSRMFSTISAQIARQYLMQSKDVKSLSKDGIHIVEQQKLVLSTVTFALTAALLVLLTAISVFLYSYAARLTTVSREPGSVIGLATILSTSLDFLEILSGAGSSTMRQMNGRLSGTALRTRILPTLGALTHSFVIEADRGHYNEDSPVPPQPKELQRYWRPISASWTIYGLVFFLPLVIIAVLESTYQYSKSHDGIANVSSSKSTTFAWSFIPALVILVLRLCFESLIFAASLFHPFSLLRRGVANVQDLLENPLGTASLLNIRNALRGRHPALLAVSLVSLLAPTLSIAVAGLFSPQTIYRPGKVVLQAVDSFDLSTAPVISTLHVSGNGGILSGVDVGNAASLYSMGLLESVDTPFPAWTWNNLAFPKLQFKQGPDVPAINESAIQTISLTVSATRANMNCSTVQSANAKIFTNGFSSAGDTAEAGVLITIPAPQGCSPLACSQGMHQNNIICKPNNSTNQWSFVLNLYTSETFVVGQWTNPANGLGLYLNKSEPYGCDVSLAWFGNIRNSAVQNMTVLQCAPYLETVDVSVTFSMPNFKISPDDPPTTIESTAKPVGGFLPSSDDGSDTAWSSLTASDDSVQIEFGDGHSYDEFFGHIVLNTHLNATDPNELLGPSNVENLKTKMNSLYGLWIAKELNFMKRSTGPTPSDSDTGHKRADMHGSKAARQETSTIHETIYHTVYTNSSTASQSSVPTPNRSYLTAPTALPEQPQLARSFPANATLTQARLMQSAVSTRVLEGLLALTWALAVLTMVMTRTRNVLPKNPCSIAGMASLMIDSDLLTLIPRGSEWLDDKDLKKIGLFQGFLFGLGWWGEGANRRWGIDVGRAGNDGG
ncbi:MAG: hypothetical protein M1828_002356 [Chrysothrix sp. TS-e1954]|nr:MAG: hypothetical protein M1828_002356 [Chrysothrix sp. TS-e1954]